MNADPRRRYGTCVWIIVELDRPGPVVFHAPRTSDAKPHIGRTVLEPAASLCGRGLLAGEIVHIEHAIRFARPCHQCWRVDQLELPGLEAAA